MLIFIFINNNIDGPWTRKEVNSISSIGNTNDCRFHIEVSMCGSVVLFTTEQLIIIPKCNSFSRYITTEYESLNVNLLNSE